MMETTPKPPAEMRYFVTLRMEGRFPSGFDSDTWEITQPAYHALRETVIALETPGCQACSTIRRSSQRIIKHPGNGDQT